MSKIGPKDTKPEIILRKIVHNMGYRYRLHRKDLPGKPDLVFPKYKKVIFMHGCFWHGHKNCKRSTLPETNRKFWENKIKGNIKTDKNNYIKLENLGWDYMIIWQCEIKKKNTEQFKSRIRDFLVI